MATPDVFGLVFGGVGGVFESVFAPSWRIAAGEDDAETVGDFAIDDSGEIIQFGDPFDPLWGLFLLRTSIPAGSTINSGYLRFVSTATFDTTSDTFTIDIADADDAAMPTDATELAAVVWTTATATGDMGSVVDGEPYDTFDISAPMQEVVNRPGFSGNFLIRVRGPSGYAIGVAAYEHPTYEPAKLFATWEEPEPPTGNRRKNLLLLGVG